MANEKIKALLNKASKKWGSARKRAEEDKGRQDWEAGKHSARITKMELGEFKGVLKVVTTYKGLSEEVKGISVSAFQQIDNEDGLFYFGRDIKRLGHEVPEDIKDVPALLAKITKAQPKVRVTAKENGDYVNYYLDKALKAGDSEEDGDEGDETAENEVELEVGMSVTFKNEDGDELKGTVKSIDEEAETATIKDEDGERHKDVAFDDIEVEEADDDDDDKKDKDDDDDDDKKDKKDKDEEEVELEKGMTVTGKDEDDDEHTGTVLSIDEDEEEVRIKDEDGKKHTLKLDTVSLEESEDKDDDDDDDKDDEDDKKKSKSGKKSKK